MFSQLNNLFSVRPQFNLRPVARTKPASLTFAALEDRNLLATIVFDPGASQVTIYGTSANDTVIVDNLSGGRISVSATGADTQAYDIDSVNRVTFYAGDGDDVFENNTSVNSLFGGHGGNDTFRGGSGNDVAYGGAGVDDLRGNGGDDLLEGGDGNDIIRGGDGADDLHGNNGDDLIYGDAGNDVLWGERDNDLIYGGDGNDTVSAFSGDDVIYGEAGNDVIYGQHGADSIFGGIGDDRVRGNPGDDIVRGESGNDFVMGDQGNDHLIGGDGNDVLLGWIGNDTIEGNNGNDELYAGDGHDELDGGAGDDFLGGEAGDDVLRGGTGNDSAYGHDGNDLLYGGAGVDLLVGNDGNDSLFGGDYSSNDRLVGNAGQDRFLVQANNNSTFSNRDTVVDELAEDAVLKFINHSSNWNDAEIEILDGGFQQLFDATGNNRLLEDSLATGDLKIFKYTVNSLGGFAGLNVLRTYTTIETDRFGNTTRSSTYEREIRIADWDENSAFYNDQFRSVTLHEIAHNWDSEEELTIGAGLTNVWDQWLGLSGWTQSGSGDWNYSAPNAAFAEAYGQTNPYEDLATSWELYFSGNADQVNNSTLQAKLDLIDDVFAAV
jgi:Ca2+-binding RTX toxin-like protein